MAENLNLKNTIVLPDPFDATKTKEFNINAVYSDEAGKVTKPLIIKESDIKVGEYYGSTNTNETTKTEINYVPATGGKFVGNVYIHEDNTSVEGISNNDIVNKGQIDTIVSELKGAPLYTWDTDNDYSPVRNEKGADYNLNTVIGSIEDLPIFEAYAEGKAHTNYVTPDSYDNAYIVYTYLNAAYFNQAYDDIKGNITKLVFPNTYIDKDTNEKKDVKAIQAGAFTAGKYENGTTYGFANLEAVHINSGITEIGNGAFLGCEKLASIAIPDSVEKVGLNVCKGCTNLTSLVLGSNITKIDAGAFSDCTSLKSIAICSSEVEIVKAKKVSSTNYLDAFYGCNALTKIYFKGSQETWNTVIKDLAEDNPLRRATVISIRDTAFPFLYICNTTEQDTSLTSNKIFLKRPGKALVEVSKGAARLERRDSKTSGNVDYFTYDVLAAVIAGINSRITALGGQTLALPEKLKIYETETTAVLDIPVNVSSADDKNIVVEDTIVPSVLDLNECITSIIDGTIPAARAVEDDANTEIKTGYYHSADTDIIKTSDKSNKISIIDYIPDKNNQPDNSQIGDICIVIATSKGV